MEKIENINKILCEYGCGKEAKFQLKNGKYCCSERFCECEFIHDKRKKFRHSDEIIKVLSEKAKLRGPLSEEIKKKISESRRRNPKPSKWKGMKHSEKSKILMSEKAKNRKRQPCSEETKRKISKANKGQIPAIKGKHHSEETKEKIRKSNIGKLAGEKNPWYGKHLTEEHKQKIREKSIGKIISNEQRKKISNSLKQLYKNQDYLNSWVKTQNIKPNKEELILLKIIQKYDFVYVGDFSYWIEGKNPDFINYDKKIIIEYFGYHWHCDKYRQKKNNDFTTNEEHENLRINYFKNFGYDCLVIWSSELKNLNELEKKIIKFLDTHNYE